MNKFKDFKMDLQLFAATVPIEFPLANIVRVDIETEEDIPEKYSLTDVYSEAEATAFLSEGEEKELRVKNTIKAQNNTEDIVKGYDIRLLSITMVPEILALVDGGKWDEIEREYTAPPIGVPVERTPFTMHVFTEEKDADGSTLEYVKFSFLHCKGTPLNYVWEDGEFFTPEMTVKSRPKRGENPVKFKILDELPVEEEPAI